MSTKLTLPLPRGATLLKNPVKRTFAGWFELTYDAKITVFGIDWYRVQGGFGSQGSFGTAARFLHDDWVADVPAVGISVTASQWNTCPFGRELKYKSRLDAMRGQLARGLMDAKRHHSIACAMLAEDHRAIEILTAASVAMP